MNQRLKSNGEQERLSGWYRLDNAAKIFPVLMRSRHSSVFSLSFLLKQPVDPLLLQEALDLTMPRFPQFQVRLRRGIFWYYLEHYEQKIKITPDVINPMRPWTRKEARHRLLRVRYYDRRISVEFFHALTDGYGASVFLRTLTAVYVSLQGKEYPEGKGVLKICEKPTAAELEDAYNRFSTFRVIRRPRQTKAFRLSGTLSAGHRLNIITGVVPVKELSAAAKRHKISVTEFLAGVYLFELYQVQQQGGYKTKRPVRVSVPVNVRRFYPTESLRNFALYANPGIEPAYGTYTFSEVLRLVHHFMRYTINEKYLNALMCANVAPEKSLFLRLSPLFIKNLAMRFVYSLTGESRFTSTLSNLGVIDLPPSLAACVERMEFTLGPSRYNPVNCAVISSKDQVVIIFSATMAETDPQRAFFRELVRQGVPVRIESNRDWLREDER